MVMFLPSFFNKKPSCHFWLCLHLEPPRRRSPTPSGRMPAEARPASHARGAIMTLALSREEGPEVTPACSSQKEPHAPQPRAAMSQDERTGQVLLGCCPLQTAVHSPKPPRLLQGGSGWHGGQGDGFVALIGGKQKAGSWTGQTQDQAVQSAMVWQAPGFLSLATC